jgi:hypothetical protein
MLVDVTREDGIDTFKYRIHFCFSPCDGIYVEHLGIRQASYSYAVVYFKGRWDCFFAPTLSIQQAKCKDLEQRSIRPYPRKIKRYNSNST